VTKQIATKAALADIISTKFTLEHDISYKLLNKSNNITFPNNIFTLLSDNCGLKCSTDSILICYEKMMIGKNVYSTADYKKSIKLDNSFVELKDESFGKIMKIFTFNDKIYTLIDKKYCYDPTQNPYNNLKILKCQRSELICCPVQFIKQKLILLISESMICLSMFPNNISLN
jgi:hypothetical protein